MDYPKTTTRYTPDGTPILALLDDAATNAAVAKKTAELPAITAPVRPAEPDETQEAAYQAEMTAYMTATAKQREQVLAAVQPIYHDAGLVATPPPEYNAADDEVAYDGKAWAVKAGTKRAAREAQAVVQAGDANKAKRQALLAETDPIANRDNRQNAALTAAQLTALAGKGKAITAAQRKELETYAQSLRDMSDLKGWPLTVAGKDWPTKPTWLQAMVDKVAR